MEKIDCTYDELIEFNKIIDHPQNPNTHSDEQIERLAKIIDYQGQRSPLVICKDTGFLIVGHGRKYAMQKLGWDRCAVNYQTFEDDAQRYAHMTADNAIGSWSELDLSMINKDIVDLGPELDLDMLGMKDFVVEPIEKLDPLTDEDNVPELKDEPITKKGDVWLLGEHRLMCGDSTVIESVEKLMNGETIDLVHTDPPYGINEKGDRSKRMGKNSLKEGVKYEDFDDSTIEVAIDAYNLCETLNIPRQVWWGANYYCHSLPQTNNWMVWDKRVEDKQKDLNSDCELAWVKSKWSSVRIFRHLWKGLIKDSEHGQARVHPTQKPVALSEWVFDYYKSDFKNVMDLFGGSGSTLIACENKDKNCFMMEYTEHYCDVIINRWQQYTGKEATLESSGETYNNLKKASGK